MPVEGLLASEACIFLFLCSKSRLMCMAPHRHAHNYETEVPYACQTSHPTEQHHGRRRQSETASSSPPLSPFPPSLLSLLSLLSLFSPSLLPSLFLSLSSLPSLFPFLSLSSSSTMLNRLQKTKKHGGLPLGPRVCTGTCLLDPLLRVTLGSTGHNPPLSPPPAGPA